MKSRLVSVFIRVEDTLMNIFPKSLLAALLSLLMSGPGLRAGEITLEGLFATPFVSSLVSSSKTSDILFLANDKGARNVFAGSAPDYQFRRITQFDEDEGREITSLSLSEDGAWAVFVRGADHGGNSAPRPINPNSSIHSPQVALYSVNLKTSEVRLLDEGDYPEIRPNSAQVSYLSGGVIKIAEMDGSSPPRRLFYDRGSPRGAKWSPDGGRLLFVSRRDSHSFIGVYEAGQPSLRWISPSFYKDDHAVWSPDGSRIAFVRQPGQGLGEDHTHKKPESAWWVLVHDLASGRAETVYDPSPKMKTLVPRWQGGLNFNWAHEDNITFLSYQDGWPHLYAINPKKKTFKQLTKGSYSIDSLSYEKKAGLAAFCANHGEAEEDIDRKQLGLIDLASGEVRFLTSGDNIVSSPSFLQGGKTLAFLTSTSKRPILPATLDIEGGGRERLLAEDFVSHLDYEALVEPGHVRYEAPDGFQVYAQLFKPATLKKGRQAPAVVFIHGGPRRQMYLGWHHLDYYFYTYALNQYLASQGYVVLSVNFRGGTGYGRAFQEAARTGAAGASEYQDILAGARWLAQQSYVDGGRIGVYGGSYGGYLTGLALGRNSDVFKAGVDIHGVHMRITNPGPPASLSKSKLVAYQSSPSYWVDDWKSPVLIIHGDDDQNVAFQQSIDLYKRLKRRDVEVETLVIPDETHHWMLFSNLLKVKQAAFNFLHKHLQ